MNQGFGQRFSELRKHKGYTQEQIADKLGVTAQAVSKWENDLSYPDITLLPKIAELFGTTIDELLGVMNKNEIKVLPENERKDFNKMLVKIIVNSGEGDKVRVNLPLSIIKLGLDIGMNMPQVSGNAALKDIDFQQIITLVEQGVIGKIVEIESADGNFVEVIVE